MKALYLFQNPNENWRALQPRTEGLKEAKLIRMALLKSQGIAGNHLTNISYEIFLVKIFRRLELL